MMESIITYYNRGRWIATCPVCREALEVKRGQSTFICTVCFPALRAMGYTQHTDKRGKVILRPCPDVDARAAAKAKAEQAGRVYRLIFPGDAKDMEKVMRKRPLDKRNWIPGETLQDLKAQNMAHGLEVD